MQNKIMQNLQNFHNSVKLFLLFMPLLSSVVVAQHEEDPDYYAPARYKFDYSVHDPESGDVKSHWESRDGDAVVGAYTVHEPDGNIRVVEYTADPDRGFNAHVSKQDGDYEPSAPSFDSF